MYFMACYTLTCLCDALNGCMEWMYVCVCVCVCARMCMCVYVSVCPHETSRLSMDGFSWNSKFSQKKFQFHYNLKTSYVKTYVHLSLISRLILLRMRNILVRSSIFIFYSIFRIMFSENLPLYEVINALLRLHCSNG